MVTALSDLVSMSQSQLDDLFRSSNVGAIPVGDGQGAAIIAPGTPAVSLVAKLARWLAWRGKVFNPRDGTLRNKITPLNLKLVKATVYKEDSWFDGKEAIILDYSKTSLLAHKIRDEMREVAPGIYLGQVFWGKSRIANFALRFPAAIG